MTIGNAWRIIAFARSTHNSPSIASVGTMIPEEHPSMTTTLKHLKLHKMPPRTKTPGSLPVAPSVQAIIVDCVPMIDPQLAAIIRDYTESVMTCPVDPQATCPTHSKVIASAKAWPSSTCVTIVHEMFPSSHVRSATVQVLATTSLTEVEGILPEETMTISGAECPPASRTQDSPSISCVWAPVPKEHTSMTTTLKHLESHKTPSANTPSSLTVAPTMQAIVVDCVPIVDPQLASIIRDNAVSVMPCPEDSHATCPTHSKVIVSGEARPSATCVPVVHSMTPASHVWPATVQVRDTTSHTKVEGILSEETMAISDSMGTLAI
jgi:hypothetical protein